MKPQFTYSLDEARIRKQLQDLKAGNAEDAWQKFSQYAESQPRQISTRKLPVIKLQLDRRILVPSAAVLVIILLAVLIFNVVDFRKSSKSSAQKAIVAEPFVPMPQVSEAETLVPPDRQEPAEGQFLQNDKALVSSKPEVVREKAENGAPPEKEPTPAVASRTVLKKETGAEAQTTQAEVKSKKREPEEQLVPLQLPDIRPTLLTEEQVDDIRPN
jgi:hypothetical protein